jgi:hypothetical protein
MLYTEAQVKDHVKQLLKKHGVFYFMPMCWVGGIPDFIACINGHFISIEAKRSGVGKKGLTALQKQCAERIIAAKGQWYCVYDDNTLLNLEIKVLSLKKEVCCD